MSIVIVAQSPGPVSLALNGMQTPIVVTGPAGSVSATGMFKTRAEFDTGSTISSVALSVLQQVGAQQVGQVAITTVTTQSVLAPIYNAGIGLPMPNGAIMPLMIGLPGELGVQQLTGNVKVLIGDDIMSKLILVRNGPAGTYTITVPATTPTPYLPSGTNTALWLGIGGLTVAAGGAAALYLTHRREEREIAGLRQAIARRAS